jgi:hypothetical protein
MSLVGVVVELRKSRRYRLLAPASFLWERSDGFLQESKGVIRDISDRGVFVTGEVVPPLDAHLEVDVYVPSSDLGRVAVQLHGEGTVVRVEEEGETVQGFAAALTFQAEGVSGPIAVSPRALH